MIVTINIIFLVYSWKLSVPLLGLFHDILGGDFPWDLRDLTVYVFSGSFIEMSPNINVTRKKVYKSFNWSCIHLRFGHSSPPSSIEGPGTHLPCGCLMVLLPVTTASLSSHLPFCMDFHTHCDDC